MVKEAEKEGLLKPGYSIVEPTSGNTGISLAMIAASKGYGMTAVMPENMSSERINIMKIFGAKVVLTSKEENLDGSIKKAEELAKNPKTFMPNQFSNPANIKAHLKTGEEIRKELGKVEVFVAGVGTGGTLMGVSKVLKEENPNLKVIAVEPYEKDHEIQGIGDGLIPPLLDENLVDERIRIKSMDAINMTKRLMKKEGLFVGISSGANILASLKIAKKYGKIVTVLPDRGDRYMSLII